MKNCSVLEGRVCAQVSIDELIDEHGQVVADNAGYGFRSCASEAVDTPCRCKDGSLGPRSVVPGLPEEARGKDGLFELDGDHEADELWRGCPPAGHDNPQVRPAGLAGQGIIVKEAHPLPPQPQLYIAADHGTGETIQLQI